MARRERVSEEREAHRPRPDAPGPERDDLPARVRALQRSAGNAAVAQLLRKGKAPDPPRAGGWNEAARHVAGTIRVEVTGVTKGNTDEDVARSQTAEGAAGKAVVIVPDGVDLSARPDILLFFHGMGNVGYRERTSDDTSRGPKGTVHDVEADQIPQQLAASGRNMIGVLPQGTNKALFGISDPQAYVDEVLGLAAAKLPPGPDGKPPAIASGRIVVSGHSGGGRAAYGAAKALTKKAPADDAEWLKAPPVLLFDGINGPGEARLWGNLMDEWLDADLARLKPAADRDKLLDRRGLRLRSTHTSSDRYTATNLGGKYVETVPLKEPDADGNKSKSVDVPIAKEQSLKGRIDGWFARHAKAFEATVMDKWRKQYDVPSDAVSGGHEATVGTGRLGKKRGTAPPGLTGDSAKAGVPEYSGGGHLEESLSKLAGAMRPPPPPPHAELEEEELEEQYA
ncbi:MAG TPA: hypothetical protein VFG79_13920 [Solirubrobacter sp.]|nr:hypothetical protein [Solirubrobacter sp.]